MSSLKKILIKEITYREFEASCEHSAKCEEIDGIDKVRCVRRCISKSCYSDIYAFDEVITSDYS